MLLVSCVLGVAFILTSDSLRRFLPLESLIGWLLVAAVVAALFKLDRLA
ncbi:MAG: hypothetical protein M0R74_15675 [Dehalococcoidia bacterium]|nr:hypothetical protein [Dehalococcoidia bacterium]